MRAFLDIETGGFSKEKNGLCEIALVATDSSLAITDYLELKVKPYPRDSSGKLVSYKDDAMKVNGLNVPLLEKEGVVIAEVLRQVLDFIERNEVKILIGHNSKMFDIPWIKYLIFRFLGETLDHLEFEDTMAIAKKKKKRFQSYSLEYLCKRFDIENIKAHSALGDALATLDLYSILYK